METKSQPYLVCLMTFLGMPEKNSRFERSQLRRDSLKIMYTTSKPVLRIPMNFVELTRESDPADIKKKTILKT